MGPERDRELGIAARVKKPARLVRLREALLCVLQPESASATGGHATSRLADASGWRFDASILVAEDNEVNQQVTVAMLEALGCSVQAAFNGREALDLLEKSRLLYTGLHWWLRGRYGKGTDGFGLLKSPAAMKSEQAWRKRRTLLLSWFFSGMVT